MLAKLPPRSILLVLCSAVFGRAQTALSQVIAAIYLSPSDFGIFATASGFMLVTTALRAGGSGIHFPTMTISEFHRDGPRIFTYSLLFIVLGVLASLLFAWPASNWLAANQDYSASLLVWTIAILTGNFVLFNIACYPRYYMLAQGRLRELSAMEIAIGVSKLLSTWILAARGYGPAALALAIFVSEAVETIWTWVRSSVPWRLGSLPPGWIRSTWQQMAGPLLLAVLAAVGGPTDSLIGSWVLPVSILGTYYFASQLASQPTMLAGSTIRSLFSNAAAFVRGDADRESESLRLVFNGSMVFIPLVTMFIPAIFDPIERALWSGKWASAAWPVRILSLAMIYPTVLQLVSAPVAGLRRWNLAVRIDLVRSMPKILAAVAAGIIISLSHSDRPPPILVLSGCIAIFTVIVSSRELYRIMLQANMSRASVTYELYSTPLAATLSAFAAGGLAQSMLEPLVPHLSGRASALLEAALVSAIYLGLSVVLLRFGYTSTLERLIDSLPDFLRTPVRRIFLL